MLLLFFKWYYKKNEADSYGAEKLYGFLNSSEYLLFAPELLIYEILNALRLKEEIKSEIIDSIVSGLYDIIIIMGADRVLLKDAFSYSRLLNISIYDNIFVVK